MIKNKDNEKDALGLRSESSCSARAIARPQASPAPSLRSSASFPEGKEYFCPKCDNLILDPKLVEYEGGVKHFLGFCKICDRKFFLEQPISQFVMPFGKFKGKTLFEIWDIDPGYCRWASEEMSNEKIRSKFEAVIREFEA